MREQCAGPPSIPRPCTPTPHLRRATFTIHAIPSTTDATPTIAGDEGRSNRKARKSPTGADNRPISTDTMKMCVTFLASSIAATGGTTRKPKT